MLVIEVPLQGFGGRASASEDMQIGKPSSGNPQEVCSTPWWCSHRSGSTVPERKALECWSSEHPQGGRQNPRKAAVHGFSPAKTDLFRKASATTAGEKAQSREASEEGREEKQDDEDNKKTLGAIIWYYFYY